MKVMLRAAVAAISIATIGAAYADGGTQAQTMFTKIPGAMPTTPVQKAPAAAAQMGQAAPTFITSSRSGYQFPGGGAQEGGNN